MDPWDIKWTRIDPILVNDGFAAAAKKINGDFRLWLIPNELFPSVPGLEKKACSEEIIERWFVKRLYPAILRELPGDTTEHPALTTSRRKLVPSWDLKRQRRDLSYRIVVRAGATKKSNSSEAVVEGWRQCQSHSIEQGESGGAKLPIVFCQEILLLIPTWSWC